jgi:light-regulated signal transduction histidine kinase (bacteriophytochrome)
VDILIEILELFPSLIAVLFSIIGLISLFTLARKLGGDMGKILLLINTGVFFGVGIHALFEFLTVSQIYKGELIFSIMSLLLSIGSIFFLIAGLSLTRYGKKIESQNEELSDFANILAHDLRNYLSQIKISCHLINELKDFSMLTQIENSVEKIDIFLSKSLKLAEAGKIIEKSDLIDLNKVLMQVLFTDLTKRLEVEYDDLPMIACDQVKTYQVFKNIIENAIIHGKPTKIRIKYLDLENCHQINFYNNGSPVPNDKLTEINKNTIKNNGKNGFGLKIIRKILDAHNWQFHLSTGKETCFTLNIPKNQ